MSRMPHQRGWKLDSHGWLNESSSSSLSKDQFVAIGMMSVFPTAAGNSR